MKSNFTYVEHRSCRRFSIQERSSLVLLPENLMSEHILDISETGIAFCYHGIGLESRIDDKAAIDLVALNVGIANVPVRIVSDCKIEGVGDEGLRRCSLEFDDLSQGQIKEIRKIIEMVF